MPKLGISKGNLVSRAAARSSELLYLALQDRKLNKKAVAHTRVGGIDHGELASAADLPWRAVGMCFAREPAQKLVMVSGDGKVFTYIAGNEGTELIVDPIDLRNCVTIDGHAYACGMGRQVFFRMGEGKWLPMHAPSASDEEVVGFECLAGFSAQELYAVGWEGEVWRCENGRWSDCNSPVNVVLSAVCCVPDGSVYACGQQGTLLRGRGDEWQCVITEDLEDDLWDLRWFNGKLYVASMSYLYILEGDRLSPVEFDIEPPSSFYKLTDAEGVLWSVGQETILSFDGKHWERWD